MRCKLIISLFCCWVFNIAVNAQTTPGIRQVVRTFYGRYNLSAFTVQQVQFQKKKDDWYIATIEYNSGKIFYNTPILFYSGKQKKYLDLEIDRNGTERTVDVSQYVDDYSLTNFDLQPYFGYPGWYLDVIKELGSKPRLRDNDLYALGRAYSAAYVSPVTNTGRDAAPGAYREFALTEAPLKGDDLRQFNRDADSAIACFARLAARNPTYPTSVGDIRLKHANEILCRYHLLLTFAPGEAEQAILPEGIYAKPMLDSARQLLNECPRNAVFLSFGDNDFYPLLYLQQKERFRRDVYVVSYSLLAVDHFIYRSTKPQFEAAPLPVSLDTGLYRRETNEYVYRVTGDDTVTIGGIINLLKQPLPDGAPVHQLSAAALRLPLKSPRTMPLSGINYLLRNHIVLLDVMANLGNRPLCISGYFTDELQPLNKWFDRKTYIGIFYP